MQRSPRRTGGSNRCAPAGRELERVRWTRVVSAQARIASGYYEREEVKSFLVEAIWSQLQQH
jgi:hypothetical protein